ncbi:hypothetical protein [Blastococcus sp. TF02A-35]|uniref:hypothetical protein n=1 Tax=Blastococcus sp. TF02A-35 TaxID=2559612 RepID=UPI001073B4BB|nr:hypothetical protein [Blastococcus sp. TF02A_35]TFV50273.1 hypothetical protein E4P43_11520 [Blastococcus sp. TF02A_35]
MQPFEVPRTAVRRRPPASAVVAAVLGILSAVVPAVVGFLALAFSTEDDVLALVVGVPLTLVVWLPSAPGCSWRAGPGWCSGCPPQRSPR